MMVDEEWSPLVKCIVSRARTSPKAGMMWNEGIDRLGSLAPRCCKTVMAQGRGASCHICWAHWRSVNLKGPEFGRQENGKDNIE